MSDRPLPWRAVPDGVELTVRLTPRAGVARVEGVELRPGGACLKVRVAAPPVDGEANSALVTFLARTLDLPRGSVRLVAGERGRLKRLHLAGQGLETRLAALASP
jgi:uncharacterized protein (TIGR00251 family)